MTPMLKSKQPANAPASKKTPKVPAKKPAAKTAKGSVPDFSKQAKRPTADPKYRPMVSRGLPEPPKEGDIIEFRHPEHGRKVRGRVTAVGQDGITARRAQEQTAIQVPHGHVSAVLPAADYGQEASVNPKDAQDAFLAPTKEGGMQATPLQVALLDVMAQFGFPIDDPATVNYDQARKLLTQYVLEDDSGAEPPLDDDLKDNGTVAKDSAGEADEPTDEAVDGSGGDEDEGEDAEMDDPKVVEAVKHLIQALELTSASNEDGPDSENDDEIRGDGEDDKPARARAKTRVKGT